VNGTEYVIAAGPYEARIVSRGAALRKLTHQGRDLVVPFDADAPIPDYRGIIAAPWPNRIADGAYRWGGDVLHLPLNEADRGTALHGLVFDRLWELETHDDAALTLRCEVAPSKGYPSSLVLHASFAVDGDGLHCAVTASNAGDRPAPYGVCPHPYLVAGESPLDEWALTFPAASFLEVTADRLLPVGVVPVDGHAFDFRHPKVVGATAIDHAFTDIAADHNGHSRLLLTDPSGSYVGMRWDDRCPWLQVHTADKEAPVASRIGLAVEPMTCPPDAFNSGTDLITLAPGQAQTAGWTIFGG
jgi:aldose 1-epimerase